MTRIVRWLSLAAATAVFVLMVPAEAVAEPPSVASDGGSPVGFSVWAGFANSWNVNHRYNRLGSWIEDFGCDTTGACRSTAANAAASGTAADTATTTIRWWQVRNNSGLGFATEAVTLGLTGREGEAINVGATARFDASALDVTEGAPVVALLNGFDLLSGADADKPRRLDFAVGDPVVSGSDVTVDVAATAVFDCATLECDTRGIVDYRFDVHVAVLSGAGLRETKGRVSRTYAWGDQDPVWSAACGVFGDPDLGNRESSGPELALKPLESSLSSDHDSTAALVAFRGLSMEMDDAHHMIAHDAALEPRDYDGRTFRFGLDMGFKNWASGMQFERRPWSLCSFGEPGQATLGADLSLVQLPAGTEATAGESACEVHWAGMNRAASGPDAVCSNETVFDADGGPQVSLAAHPQRGAAPLAVELTADTASGVAEYRWDFDGDGSPEETTTVPTASHVYALPGRHEARVTAVEANGNARTVSTGVEASGSVLDVSVTGTAAWSASGAARGTASVTRDDYGIGEARAVLGTGTAEFRLHARRLGPLPIHVGSLTLVDTATGLRVMSAFVTTDLRRGADSLGGAVKGFALGPKAGPVMVTWQLGVFE